MVRVLHVMGGMDAADGGPAFAVGGLSRAQLATGVVLPRVVTAFRAGDSAAMPDALAAAGVPVERVGPGKGPTNRHPGMKALVRRLASEADVVHSHGVWDAMQHAAASAARATGTPLVVRPCGMLDPWSLSQSKWKKRLALLAWVRRDLNSAAALHYTAELERDLAGPVGLRPSAIVEPNGVDLGDVATPADESESLRARFPGLGDGPVVVFLSRLHHKKGVETLIEAFDGVLSAWTEADGPEPGLVLVGPDEGGYRAVLEERVAAMRRPERVHFAGMLTGEAKAGALQTADVFCLPSYQENFGIAVVEALAAGLPVVISEHVNIYREIAEAGLGEATAVDAGEVTAALLGLLRDPARRAGIRERAPGWVRGRYDWGEIAGRWAGHYERLLTNRGE